LALGKMDSFRKAFIALAITYQTKEGIMDPFRMAFQKALTSFVIKAIENYLMYFFFIFLIQQLIMNDKSYNYFFCLE